MTATLKSHWPEYLIEAAALGLFMVSATGFTMLLEHPASPVHQAIAAPMARRVLMGLLMGGTAIALIYSPWGRRSGAHMNPSVTVTFLRLGKIDPADAAFYVAAQFAGGLLAVLVVARAAGRALGHPAVNYAATLPGPGGIGVAFAAETAISFLLMLTVLTLSNSRRAMHLTGIAAGLLVASFITFEAPLSGMSMNPARTLASDLPAGAWGSLWIYFTAPLLGMLIAAETFVRARGARAVLCAKLEHDSRLHCIFRCAH
ncbi:MAG TPA: aquaporin [Candidatus Polarisedimenticolia bacterium]|jgi:aquaporin Z|nr:aquaporin [Candidatus Polarisedimenticolia bacterium]